MKYNPYLQAQYGIKTPDEGTFPQYQYYPYLYDNADVGSFPRTVPWSNPIDNRMEMTDANYIQMFDEGSKKWIGNEIGFNNYDRINPDKSNIQDYITSPQIQPRESYQPTLLRNRIQPLQNFSVENVRDITSPGGTMPTQQPLETPYLDAIMNQGSVPIDYAPFASEDEMNKFYNPRTQEPEIGITVPPIDIKDVREPEKLIYKKFEPNMDLTGVDISRYNNFMTEPPIIPEPDLRINNEPEITLNNNQQKQTLKNKFGTPEAYYLGKSMLDATALINNMVQPQPPSLQMKIPHYERQRLDPTPYDAMRSQMRDQGTQAYRLQRENISQASDLMKGLSAVTSGTQQGLMNVGMQQAAAEQQIQGINQQISMQEQQQQTQMLNQEAATNYQIQQQAQQYKDQMVSAQLARLGDTAGAYAKYVNMKNIVEKQDAVNKAAIQSTNDIQNAMLQYQMHKDAMDSDEYKSAWAQHWTKTLDQMSTDKIKDEKFGALKEYYGEMSPRYSDYQRIAMDPTFTKSYYQNKNNYENFQRLYPGGVGPDKTKYTSEEDYNKALADFQKAEANSKAFTEDKSYKQFEQMQDFWTEIGNERDESGERKRFADQYMGQRGYYTTEQLLKTVQEALDRSKQSLEI